MNNSLRDYQIKNANECTEILLKYGIVYLQHEMRVGKTLSALQIAKNVDAKRVLFVTKKKAIESIRGDYRDFCFTYELDVVNYEMLHTIGLDYDLVILDEASCLGAIPKPSIRTKLLRKMFFNKPMVFLSGTPASETYSSWYHQFWISSRSPFKEYINFYKWAKDFTTPSLIYTSYGQSNDYSKALVSKIDAKINHLVHKYTQQDAGFENKLIKIIHQINMKPITYNLIDMLKKDKCIIGNTGNVIADSSVKLMSKQHQIGSGTIILDTGKSITIDSTKAIFIKEQIKGKLAIFYYFKEELNMLLEVFRDSATTQLDEFNNTDKHYIGQQYSSSMGINLSKADALVYLNFGFSGTNYIQSLDRLTILGRKETDVHFILAKNTLDYKILRVLESKKNFTLSMYKKC